MRPNFFTAREPNKDSSVQYLALFSLALLCSTFSWAEASEKRVTTAPLSSIATYPLRSAPASVISLNEPAISAQLNARLEQLLPLVGQRVKRNEVLARLDCREFELNKRTAEAQLANVDARLALAETRLERTRSLVADQLVPQEQMDARNAEVQALAADRRAAAATVDLAELQVERCTLRAPFDALVTERSADVGQLLVPGTPVAKLLDLSQVEITARIPTTDTQRITDTTEFALNANSKEYPIVLRILLDAIDPTTRNREARFAFAGEPALIGSAGKIIWRDPRPHVDPELLVERNGQLGIFTIRDGNSLFIPLQDAQPGRSNPVDLPLTSQIVTEGYLGLTNGEPVLAKQ
jgi:RND family efflux transporter MFP subunit